MKKVNIQDLHSYSDIERILFNDDLIIVLKDTNGINDSFLNKLSEIEGRTLNKLKIEVLGSYDGRLRRYDEEGICASPEEDVIYNVSELKAIMNVINDIESGINPDWDQMQKLVYLINRVKNSIIYHPFHEIQPSKDIRSLRGLVTGKTVCAGYAMILKELCDRNGIKCHYALGTTLDPDKYSKRELSNHYHAWNIVEINGNMIPIDLTWNAGKTNKGNTLNVGDIGNVNDFIKSHYPLMYEPIKDYDKLKNVSGNYLRSLENLISKEVVYKNTSFRASRKDKTRFDITQVQQRVVDGEYYYKYVYQEYDKNNKLSDPIILYSKTNISNFVNALQNREKKIKQLETLRNKSNKTQRELDDMKELESFINNTRHCIRANSLIINLLFSRENIEAARRRGDYFIGALKNQSEEKNVYDYRVIVDPVFGKHIPYNQKTIKRSDGTSFVLETYPSNGSSFNRYNMYESVSGSVKRNTILTDKNEDLMFDNRREVADIFLDRKRIDRKNNESGGYIGYLDSKGLKNINISNSNYFRKDVYKEFKFDERKVRNYYKSITFEEIERLASTYMFDGLTMDVVNRRTGVKLEDPVLKVKAQFANLWLHAAGSKYLGKEEIPGSTYAFSEQSKRAFDVINRFIEESMNKNGNIDVYDLYEKIESINYKYADEIVLKLFKGEAINIINKVYRLQNPSSMPEVPLDMYYSDGQFGEKYSKRIKELEELKKQLLEVVENNNGQISVEHKR